MGNQDSTNQDSNKNIGWPRKTRSHRPEEIHNEKDWNMFDNNRYYVAGLNIDGVDYTTKIVVRAKSENTYYDHALTQIKKVTSSNKGTW